MSQKRSSARKQSRRLRHRRSAGWFPDQHGAWFMVTVPPATGLLANPTCTGVLLTATWLFGYFAFFATTVWLRARRQRRHLAPVVVYCSLTATFGLLTLLYDVSLVKWVPTIAPLAAIAIWETYRRRPRSLLSGVATVLAASLMVPVVAGPSPKAWATAAIYAGFFVGTVPYVKTLIRERGSRLWFMVSAIYHTVLLCAAISAWLVLDDELISVGVPIVGAALLVRAVAMPITGARRARPWTPKQVGMLDATLTVAVVLAAL